MAKARATPLDNPRSRASRRATSPSLNTDKSLKEAPRASDATPGLAPYRGAGIQKKVKKKHLSHGQRVRHEKGLARGEAIQDRLDVKVAEAKSRLKKRQSRRALWEEVNVDSNEEVRKAIKAPGRFEVLDEDDELKDEVQAFPGDTEIKVIGGVQVPAFATGEALNVAVAPISMSNGKKPGTFGVTPNSNEAPPLMPSTKKPGTFGVGGKFEPSQTEGFDSVQAKELDPIDEIT
ncbi:hypothetical protein PMZ80_008610 [Knufia obscura]|uniref:Uncharacterized protein n=1 Tax=Knufia obscura TaxID=1635080 RepID=A0ABR0RF96_9EURO|nr:hypothetical protein PMZ80_008610 [Knufia obscura]